MSGLTQAELEELYLNYVNQVPIKGYMREVTIRDFYEATK